MMKDTPFRSITKGVSWRIFASIDTFFLSWFILGNPLHAGSIAGFELLTKILLYFLHERLWNLIPFGRGITGKVAHWRSITKGITWRFVGSVDTIFISWIISGKLLGSIQLGGMEVVTKILLFYIHERIWVRIKWGRVFDEKMVLTAK